MPITPEIQKHYNDLFEALVLEFMANEKRHGRFTYDIVNRQMALPAPWIETMLGQKWRDAIGVGADETFLSHLNMFIPLHPHQLSPMSELLEKITAELMLPTYQGTAGLEPHVPQHVSRTRCPQCGTKMKPVEEVKWEKTRQHHGSIDSAGPVPKKLSGQMKCKSCGYECMLET